MARDDELFTALLTSHFAARPRSRTDEDVNRELSELRSEVAKLRRALTALVGFLEEEEGSQRARRLHARMLEAIRKARLDEEEEEEPAADAEPLGTSPYRGTVPSDSGRGCAVCGKRLDPDDPELTLATRGSVCFMCFQRGA